MVETVDKYGHLEFLDVRFRDFTILIIEDTFVVRMLILSSMKETDGLKGYEC